MPPSMKVRLTRKMSFCSGHRYHNPQLSSDENQRIYGSLISEQGLGHNFILETSVEGEPDPKTGMVINLSDLDRILREVTDPLDHHHLNLDMEYFKKHIPTAENIADYLFHQVEERLRPFRIQLKSVKLYEGENLWIEVCQNSH